MIVLNFGAKIHSQKKVKEHETFSLVFKHCSLRFFIDAKSKTFHLEIMKNWCFKKNLSTYCLLKGFWDSDTTGKIGFYRFDKISGASRPRNHLYFLTSFLGLFMRKRSVSPATKLVVFWAWEQRKWAFIFRKIVDNYHDVAVLVVPYTSCRHHHQKVQKLKRGNRNARAGATFLKGNSQSDAESQSLTGKWRQFPWKNRQVENNKSKNVPLFHHIFRFSWNANFSESSSNPKEKYEET